MHKEDKDNKKKKSDKRDERCLTCEEIDGMLKEFDVSMLTMDSFVYCVAPRRSGKTTLVESLIHQFRKHLKPTGIFLFSQTGAGFPGIPKSYRFRTLANYEKIIKLQLKVKRHNAKQKKDSDKVESRVICIIDDFLDGSKSVRHNKTLIRASTQGRHWSGGDVGLKDNGIMTIILSQDITMCPPVIRKNMDFLITTKVASRLQRKAMVEQYMCVRSGRQGLKEGYNLYDVCSLRDYQFLIINATASNKYDYDCYCYKYIAQTDLPEERWTGNKSDWDNNELEIIY